MPINDGFSKINVETTPPENQPAAEIQANQNKIENPVKESKIEMKKTPRLPIPKKFLLIPAAFILFIIFLIGVTIIMGRDFYYSVKKVQTTGREALAAAKTQNLDETQKKFKQLELEIVDAQNNYQKLAFLGYIPLINAYYNDGRHALNAGLNGVQAGIISVSAVTPYADLLGLKGKSKFVSGSADQRIQTAVKTLDKVTPQIGKISEKIAVVKNELDEIDPNRYPEKIGNTSVKPRLISYRELFDNTANLFLNATPLLEELPKLLGEPKPKRYLVLFQNDKELRPTGGFITAYAVFKVEGGKLTVEKSDDIYKLDEMKPKKFPAPPEILKYHKGVYSLELRDSNLSPDFDTSMKKFEELLSSVDGFPEYDGIIALDTHVLVSSVEILGEFNIAGRKFSAEIDERCDCPKVVYELEDYATRPVAYVRADRKDIISTLLYEIMQRALGVSPSQYWGRLFQMGLEEMEQKHILFALKDAKAQKGIENLNFGGHIKAFDGNYLHINDANMAGAKSNLFVKESIDYDLNVDGNGQGTVTLTIDYKNPAPPSDCNLESGGLCLNGLLRNWVRIYVPKGSQLIEFKGSEVDTTSYTDLGHTVFEGFLTVKPQGSGKLTVKYKLPSKIESGIDLPLLIQKQPGTNGNKYTIKVNGRQIDKFPLLTDKKIIYKI
ncbi:DUF4012 domain-containing protein [Candidatus Gottesmanbacteria bacterium]|nr:DUF4012 domain-containing protein [Candidatus Gottesmanbacteria bacterium]